MIPCHLADHDPAVILNSPTKQAVAFVCTVIYIKEREKKHEKRKQKLILLFSFYKIIAENK